MKKDEEKVNWNDKIKDSTISFKDWIEDVEEKAKKDNAFPLIPLEYITGEDWLRQRRRKMREMKEKDRRKAHDNNK